MQTISRVNRIYEGKDKRLIVDYIGIKNFMNAALKKYAGGGHEGTSVETIEDSVRMVKDELDLLRRIFNGFDYTTFTTGAPLEQLECLNRASEFIQATKQQENRFMGHAKKMKSAYNLCATSEQITDVER